MVTRKDLDFEIGSAMVKMYMRSQFPHVANIEVSMFKNQPDLSITTVIRFPHKSGELATVQWNVYVEQFNTVHYAIPQEKIAELMLLTS